MSLIAGLPGTEPIFVPRMVPRNAPLRVVAAPPAVRGGFIAPIASLFLALLAGLPGAERLPGSSGNPRLLGFQEHARNHRLLFFNTRFGHLPLLVDNLGHTPQRMRRGRRGAHYLRSDQCGRTIDGDATTTNPKLGCPSDTHTVSVAHDMNTPNIFHLNTGLQDATDHTAYIYSTMTVFVLPQETTPRTYIQIYAFAVQMIPTSSPPFLICNNSPVASRCAETPVVTTASTANVVRFGNRRKTRSDNMILCPNTVFHAPKESERVVRKKWT